MGNITVSSYWQNKGFTNDEEVAKYKRSLHVRHALASRKRAQIKQDKDQYSLQIRKLFLGIIGNIEYKNEMADEFINSLFEQFKIKERSMPKKKL